MEEIKPKEKIVTKETITKPTPEPQPIVEPVPIPEIPFKLTGSRLKIILLAILGLAIAGGLICVGYRLGQKQAKPGPISTPAAVATPALDSTANWQEARAEMADGTQVSFRHPMEWSDELVYCQNLQQQPDVPPGCVKTDFLSRESAQDVATGIFGETLTINTYKVIKDVNISPEYFGPIYTALFFDKQDEPFFGLVAYIGAETEEERANSLIKTLDLILSTFRFLEEENQETSEEEILCDEPRPEVCTMECISPPPYICGSNGKFYCNKCAACADWKVDWYIIQNEPCGI